MSEDSKLVNADQIATYAYLWLGITSIFSLPTEHEPPWTVEAARKRSSSGIGHCQQLSRRLFMEI